MTTTRRQRGATLLEAMIAMGVLMIGAAGLVGLQRQSTFFMGDSRRTTRAGQFAQDLVNQIEGWDYTDPRLDNKEPANDKDIGDGDGLFEAMKEPPYDHAEADLGAGWNGLSKELLEVNEMERYWNVADGDDFEGNGTVDAKRIAVIVRWRAGASWRKTVFMVTKINGEDRL